MQRYWCRQTELRKANENLPASKEDKLELADANRVKNYLNRSEDHPHPTRVGRNHHIDLVLSGKHQSRLHEIHGDQSGSEVN